jgi:hypothetical protein
MSRIRRGNYVFVTCVGDHPPRHMHVYRDDKFNAKWNLEEWCPAGGIVSRRIKRYLEELECEGKL